MLKIRLKRVGRRNDPSFRIVVTESARGPKSNRAVDLVGFYNPRTKERKLDGEKIQQWMSNGAQVSDTVHNILVDAGIIQGTKKNVLPQKSPVVKEEGAEEKTEATTDTSDGEAEETPEQGKETTDESQNTEAEPSESTASEEEKTA